MGAIQITEQDKKRIKATKERNRNPALHQEENAAIKYARKHIGERERRYTDSNPRFSAGFQEKIRGTCTGLPFSCLLNEVESIRASVVYTFRRCCNVKF